MTSEQYARFVLPIIRKNWESQMAAVPSGFESLFGIDSSTASVEYSQGVGSSGLISEYNSASAEGEPGAIKYSSFDQLYEKTFTHKEYADGMAIERKLFDDDQSGIIRRRAQSFGLKFGNTIAYHMASVFNNAFSASYVGADSVALCSASHPLSKSNAGLFSNAGSSALSYANITATIAAGMALTDDKSLPMPVIYDRLIVPPALEATAREIVNAMGKPGTANNDANALQGRELQLISSPWLSDSNNWFMVDSMQSPLHLLWFWRVRPEVDLDPSSNFNLVAKYRGYMRMSYGWDDPRWIYGHLVA
jgi:phage major head subunit gpT-like protein